MAQSKFVNTHNCTNCQHEVFSCCYKRYGVYYGKLVDNTVWCYGYLRRTTEDYQPILFKGFKGTKVC